ncbi:GH24207 [Drosophila grimshawi]|uniref:GH24207 n=1 Tax=Drosophila grimshawi TaxID=7222 RepID=B4JN43_DROGR|nr:GH24207 [Drosophila grimshawi]
MKATNEFFERFLREMPMEMPFNNSNNNKSNSNSNNNKSNSNSNNKKSNSNSNNIVLILTQLDTPWKPQIYWTDERADRQTDGRIDTSAGH